MIPPRFRSSLGILALGLLCHCGGSAESTAPSDEEEALARYFAAYPGVPAEHHTWHHQTDPSGREYGETFFAFHRAFIGRYETWRQDHGLAPLVPWDPGTPIPEALRHAGRDTDDPSARDPLCRRPAWLTRAGVPGQRDPEFGAGRLADFTSVNQLGRSVDSQYASSSWHRRVHTTIGGDMGDFSRNPYDPVFWNFHKFIDGIWIEYEAAVAELGAENPTP